MNKIISLKLNTQFKRLYSKGDSCVRPAVVLYVKKNGLSYNRLGITVGKKIGKAVVRNRAKRRLRELYRTNVHIMRGGYDIVMVARNSTVDVPYQKLVNDFNAAILKLGILKND